MTDTRDGALRSEEPPAPRAPRRISRRAVLIGSAAAGALAIGAPAASLAGLLPGRSTLFRLLGLDGAAGTVPDATPGPLLQGAFASEERLGIDCGWAVSYPPGSSPGDPLPVAVVLHGYSDDHRNAFGADRQGFDHFLAHYVDNGGQRFAIASVDGGNTYWHRRRTGEDSSRMIVDEFLPILASHGLATDRVALLGWSMGGYGALRLAGMLGPDRVSAVAAASPALWQAFPQAPRIAFDDEADFAANTVYGRQRSLAGIPVRVDCGTGDGFYSNDHTYVAGFPHRPSGGFTPGGHNLPYWLRINPAQLRFIGDNIA